MSNHQLSSLFVQRNCLKSYKYIKKSMRAYTHIYICCDSQIESNCYLSSDYFNARIQKMFSG